MMLRRRALLVGLTVLVAGIGGGRAAAQGPALGDLVPGPEALPYRHAEAAAGFFFAIDAELVKPHLQYRVAGDVLVAGIPDTVHLPAAPLDWAASPRFEVGFRFGDGLGSMVASYRPLSISGNATVTGFGLTGVGDLRTRLDLNVLDLDYATAAWVLPGAGTRGQWRVGARVAGFFTDTRATEDVLSQRSSSSFDGLGPHVGLDLWQPVPVFAGLGLFVRVEGAAVFGQTRQAFEEVAAFPGVSFGGATDQKDTAVVPTFQTQIGLSWSSGWRDSGLTFATGYQYEQWWNLGHLGDNRVGLNSHGVFFRVEWSY